MDQTTAHSGTLLSHRLSNERRLEPSGRMILTPRTAARRPLGRGPPDAAGPAAGGRVGPAPRRPGSSLRAAVWRSCVAGADRVRRPAPRIRVDGVPLGSGPRARVPTRFVSKYTARAQLKPLGCSRAGLRARETGGGGRPARFCQEQTLVLAEQFGSTEHDGFRIPYLSENTPEAPFHGQAGRLCSRTFAARP